ncbi:hypothetical protein M426DRAFT_315880 [Hypoxylon sp. CI-4A]|nr:hypothetical protein M426DRAFT_315880 [Hypoxylon sp. CI-4A]
MDPNKTPALRPPPGVEPNLINPATLLPLRIAVSATCLALSIAFVAIRIYMRALIKKFDMEDGVHIFSLLSFAAYVGVSIDCGIHGDGKHQWNVTLNDFSKDLQLQNIAEILYCLTMFTAKYVVLRQIQWIFCDRDRKGFTYKAAQLLIWLSLANGVSAGLLFIFSCTPREKIWHPYIKGHCVNTGDATIGFTCINTVADFLILMIPLAAVFRLQMPLAKKIRAAAGFSVGIFACVASVVRLYTL